jgi:hypothetical protein
MGSSTVAKTVRSAHNYLPKLRGQLAVFILATALTAYFLVAVAGIVFGACKIMNIL